MEDSGNLSRIREIPAEKKITLRKMPEIVISDRRDPDFPTLLPFRWGEDWQVEEILPVYLNGEDGLLLKLMPLVDKSLPELKLKFGHQYYYCPILTEPVPKAIGSSFGELWIVSEINQCLLDIWGQGEIPCWRLTKTRVSGVGCGV